MTLLARLRHAPWEPAVYPLADDAGALLVGGRELRALQTDEALAAGFTLKDSAADAPLPAGTEVACTLDAVFSRETIEALVAAARSRGGVVQAAIAAGTPLCRAAARLLDVSGDADLRLPLWAGDLGGRVPATGGDPLAAFPDASVAAVCDENGAERVRVPPHGRPPHVLEMPAVARLGGRLTHWLHALDLSLAALWTLRQRLGLLSDTRTRNQLGDVDIHPTATVIGSILEDGVRVEPHASVIGSYVGKDCLVADHSVIHTSVIGDRCRTLVDTSLRRIVAMPDSTLSNIGISDIIIGRNVFLTTSVATFGPAPGDNAFVEGKDTGRAFLGGAIGARCVLGSRALLQAGTALPPGLLVVARPEEAAQKLDAAGLARATMMLGNRREQA